MQNKRREVLIKWVGYPDSTQEPEFVLGKNLLVKLHAKSNSNVPYTLSVEEIWNDFFDSPDSSIFNTETAKSAYNCNTNKDVVNTQSKGKMHNWVAALCIGVGADGVVESVYESFRSESLSQLWLHKLYLTQRYPQLSHDKTIVGYDDVRMTTVKIKQRR